MNLVEFATGSNPNIPNFSPLTAVGDGDFRYLVDGAVSDEVSVSVEWTNTLQSRSWRNDFLKTTEEDGPGGLSLLTTRLEIDMPHAYFFRLRVERP